MKGKLNGIVRGLIVVGVPIAVFALILLVGKLLWGDKSKATISINLTYLGDMIYAPDGSCVAVKSVNTGSILIVDLAKKEEVKKLGEESLTTITDFSYTADGQYIYAIYDQTDTKGGKSGLIIVWNVESGDKVNTFTVPEAWSYKFTADLQYVAALIYTTREDGSFYSNTGNCYFQIWDMQTQTLVSTINTQTPVHSVTFSPDGKTIAVSEDKQVEILDGKTGAQQFVLDIDTQLENCIPGVSYSPDGSCLCLSIFQNDGNTTEKRAIFYGTDTYQERYTLNGFWPYSYSSDGTYMIGSYSGTGNDVLDIVLGKRGLSVIKLSDGSTVMKGISGHKSGINAAVFSPDMKTIATSGQDYTIKLWDFRPKD